MDKGYIKFFKRKSRNGINVESFNALVEAGVLTEKLRREYYKIRQ